ncbi:uncharacterized protein LOC118113678 [Hippoglossus stenolepis]|uniref:uncharacterized protein LOC118113678 n=1 Tax=Hippoglossus stenolepis TaxID=195615 RepID=UPI001FAFCE79|nr:uncharacterized protein LOC118113678 [Hippoglossus stenolepis]
MVKLLEDRHTYPPQLFKCLLISWIIFYSHDFLCRGLQRWNLKIIICFAVNWCRHWFESLNFLNIRERSGSPGFSPTTRHWRPGEQTLEETLAEACQLGLESDWQGDVAERLQQVDAEQERESERLAQLHRQTLAEEQRLADTTGDVAGRKVVSKELSLAVELEPPPCGQCGAVDSSWLLYLHGRRARCVWSRVPMAIDVYFGAPTHRGSRLQARRKETWFGVQRCVLLNESKGTEGLSLPVFAVM